MFLHLGVSLLREIFLKVRQNSLLAPNFGIRTGSTTCGRKTLQMDSSWKDNMLKLLNSEFTKFYIENKYNIFKN